MSKLQAPGFSRGIFYNAEAQARVAGESRRPSLFVGFKGFRAYSALVRFVDRTPA
jgi:hypothetical protein